MMSRPIALAAPIRSFFHPRSSGIQLAAATEFLCSPQMVFAHYRQLVTETQAKEWFGIVPPAEWSNVEPMPAASVVAESASAVPAGAAVNA